MSTPFKMKAGSSPMKHFFGKHPSKKDGHKRSEHKAMKKGKKIAEAAGEYVGGVMAKDLSKEHERVGGIKNRASKKWKTTRVHEKTHK